MANTLTTKVTTTCCIEWKVTVCDTMSLYEPGKFRQACVWLVTLVSPMSLHVGGLFKRIWNMVVSDPRKAIHGLKVAFALTVMSLFYYVRPLYDGIGGTAIGAVMTVATIFDFTVGATIYRAFNRVTATILAGSLAIGINYVADGSAQAADPLIRSGFVFVIALVSSFARLVPSVKRQYDYGMMTFILTFSLVSISGYRVDELIGLAQHRSLTIALGSSVCVIVCMLVNPIWAGSDLHVLCVKNLEKLAASLDGLMSGYFMECGEEIGKQVLQGYKCVLDAKASEDSLANLAKWEPPHGLFPLQHPWQKYLKIGAAMRKCACCLDALDSFMRSETQTQAPEHMKPVSLSFLRLSFQSSLVLKDLAKSVKYMMKSRDLELLLKDMGLALGELQIAIKSFLNQVTTSSVEDKVGTKQGKQALASLPLVEVMPLVTIASHMIEISARIAAVVDAVNDLADVAFYDPSSRGKSSVADKGEQGAKALEPENTLTSNSGNTGGLREESFCP